jgi:hypothetical protein
MVREKSCALAVGLFGAKQAYNKLILAAKSSFENAAKTLFL